MAVIETKKPFDLNFLLGSIESNERGYRNKEVPHSDMLQTLFEHAVHIEGKIGKRSKKNNEKERMMTRYVKLISANGGIEKKPHATTFDVAIGHVSLRVFNRKARRESGHSAKSQRLGAPSPSSL